MIKFLDIYKQDKVLHKSILQSIKKLFKNGDFILGKEVEKFEINFAKFCGSKYAISCGNGTDALTIALKVLNLPNDSEVIIPAMTYCSTAFAVLNANLKPVLVDTEYLTPTINIEDLKKKITKKTKALMIPHIYGFPCEMDKILNICKKYKLYLIEDAAEMIGQTYKNKPCGSFGDISTFSFYANKHITTGEGGMVFTNNKNFFEKFNSFKNLSFGKKNRFNHSDISWNYRITNMQAALGVSQVSRLKKIIKKKREIGNFYYEKFKNNKNLIIQPTKFDYAENIFWIYGIVLKKGSKKYRQEIQSKLLKINIDTRSFFWPMHKQDIFKKMGLFKKEKYPVSEFLSNNGFYIPSGINLSYAKLNYIANSINQLTSK